MLLSPLATILVSAAALAMIQPAPSEGDAARAAATADEEVAEAREEAAEPIEQAAREATEEASEAIAEAMEDRADALRSRQEAAEEASAADDREICRRVNFADDYGRMRSRRVCRPASEARPPRG